MRGRMVFEKKATLRIKRDKKIRIQYVTKYVQVRRDVLIYFFNNEKIQETPWRICSLHGSKINAF